MNLISSSFLIFKHLIWQVHLHETSFKFIDPLQDRKLIGHELYRVNALTEMQCSTNVKCHSTNHHEENQICILNNHPSIDGLLSDEVTPDRLIAEDGWKFFQKTEVLNLF